MAHSRTYNIKAPYNRNILLVSVEHDKPINADTKKEIFDFYVKFPNSKILVEEDFRLPPHVILAKTNFNEPTTKLVVKELKKYKRKSIGGWDPRPAILTFKNENYQEALYGFYQPGNVPKLIDLKLIDIYMLFINKLPKNFQERYLETHGKIFDALAKKYEKEWDKTLIRENYHKDKKLFDELFIMLREDFKDIADYHVEHTVKNTYENLVIIAGSRHIDNLRRLLK